MLDLFYPYIPYSECMDAVSEVLRTRWIGQGPKVDQFEKEFKTLFDVPFAVSVNSGTAALETAYDLIDLKPGDEVISTPLTCTATNIPLLRRGVKIVWADILKDTLCIDPEDVKRKITHKTKAVVQVHLGGIKADVGKLHIPVVSDACQALGIFNGDYTCCSFQAIKHITTGDGGMFVCNKDSEEHLATLLRWFGIDRKKKQANNWQAYKKRKMTFDIEVLGTKRHMNDLSAALGIVGLRHYEKIITHRKELFLRYRDNLDGLDGIKVLDGDLNTYWLATVLVDRRDDFVKALFEADIDTNLGQVRNDIYKIFGGVRADLPVMNEVEDQYLCLPIGMHLTVDDIDTICDVVKAGW